MTMLRNLLLSSFICTMLLTCGQACTNTRYVYRSEADSASMSGNGQGYDGKVFVELGASCADSSPVKARIELRAGVYQLTRESCADYATAQWKAVHVSAVQTDSLVYSGRKFIDTVAAGVPAPSRNQFSVALNFNGPDLFTGQLFGSAAAFGANGTFSLYENQNAALNPMPDANTAQMIRSSFGPVNGVLDVNVPVPNGTYEMYYWTWADPSPGIYGMFIQGEKSWPVSSPAAGGWERRGPVWVTVTNEVFNIRGETISTDFLLSGLELRRAPISELWWPADGLVDSPSKGVTLVTHAVSDAGIQKVEFFENGNFICTGFLAGTDMYDCNYGTPASPGPVKIKTVVTDSNGNVTSVEHTLVIQ